MVWEVASKAPPPIPCKKRKSNQFPDPVGIAAEKGADRENDDGGSEIIPAPELGCQPAGHRNDDHVSDRVSGNHPRHFREGGAEVAAHIIERHINDGGVYNFKQGTNDGRNGDDDTPRTIFYQ